MPITAFCLLRHRIASVPTSNHNQFLRRHVTILSAAKHHHKQNPNEVSRRPQLNKNLLKAKQQKQSVKEYSSSSSSSSLLPVLYNNDDFTSHLSESQDVGTVVAAQANFMRVIVQQASRSFQKDANVFRTTLLEDSKSSGVCKEDSSRFQSGEEGCEGRVGVELLCVVKAVLKKIKRRVLVGDKVVVGSIDWVDKRGMIENVFQRKSQTMDPPVANVDHLLVLFSMDQPRLEPTILTRFLVDAESTGIPLTLALNKSELADEETVEMWKARLRSWGYQPLFCSVEYKHGLDTLAYILRDQTTVIVGPSGVGKSSLINALRSSHEAEAVEGQNWFDPIMGSKWYEDQRVGEISIRSGRGKHTTRNVSLLPLSGGGYLADTPGFNQPSLVKVTKQSLPQCFPEIRKMVEASQPKKCAFNDCMHVGEPGCVLEGDWERFPYYLQLLDEIRIREEFQLRTFGTKREADVRYKVGEMGIQQAEPRLEPKKHRRQSRKRINQSILDELEEFDDDDNQLDDENDPILRAVKNENE